MYYGLQLFLALGGGLFLGIVIGHFLRRADDHQIIKAQSRTIQSQYEQIGVLQKIIVNKDIANELLVTANKDLEVALLNSEEYIKWSQWALSQAGIIPEEKGGETN
jgi:hypothetical protein